ncbi:MAG: tyrosine-type recombinase/integrase [Clostridia bacterium]|nr:tyrosine-type recombinase/integrase [Clostridia bacterium]
METVKGRSANTVNGYFIDLRTFFRFLLIQRNICVDDPDHLPDITLVDIPLLKTVTLFDLFEFMNYAKSERENSNVTRARKVSSLRRFFHYLCEITHQMDTNPAKNLSSPKLPSRMPKYLSYDQSVQLLRLASQGRYPERDYCILTLLLNCGLRRAEVAGLNRTDVRDDNTLRVIGKGNKERILYLNQACQEALAAYLPKRPLEGTKDKKALFYGHTKDRISLQGIHYIVKSYLKQVTGAEEYSAHKLRHTAATLMYQQGGVDVLILKEILGHQNLGTTEIYTHISGEQMKRAADANPLSGIHPTTPAKRSEKDKDENEGTD